MSRATRALDAWLCRPHKWDRMVLAVIQTAFTVAAATGKAAASAWAWLCRRPKRDRAIMASVGAVLVIAGIAVVVSSGSNSLDVVPLSPPTPTAAAAPAFPSAATSPAAVAAARDCVRGVRPTGRAAPLRVCIAAIKVDAPVIQLGLNPDRTIEVPALSQVADAGWYRYSPQPGDIGPTVVLGHVDSAKYGKGVFFNLGQLHAGDEVNVVRGDGAVATFRINKVAQYPKSAFPTQSVYGATAGATIRLITCGGRFDAAKASYVDNIIAFGELRSLTPSAKR